MTPDQLLEQLKQNCSSRKLRNLEILQEICRKQSERGGKDFSIATIGRLSAEKGGPATQSIRNKTGNDFKALISAWAGHTGGSTRKLPKPNENPIFAVLDLIPDPAVRAVMGTVLAENKKLRGQIDLLKRHSEIVIDRRPVSSSGTYFSQQIGEPHSVFKKLTESEKIALCHAISDDLIKQEGWEIDQSGRVLNHKKRPIFKAGFATGMKKIISSLSL